MLWRATSAASDACATTSAEEIQRFTLRRTKAQLNAAVAAAPDLYRHPRTGAVCQYPHHEARTYGDGGTPADEQLATDIHDVAQGLCGLARIADRRAAPPPTRKTDSGDGQPGRAYDVRFWLSQMANHTANTPARRQRPMTRATARPAPWPAVGGGSGSAGYHTSSGT